MKKKKRYKDIVIDNKYIFLTLSLVTFLVGLCFLIPVMVLVLGFWELENTSPSDFSKLTPKKNIKIEAVPFDDKLVLSYFKETPSVFFRTCYKEYFGSPNNLKVKRCKTVFGKHLLRFKSGDKIYSLKINNLSPMFFTEEDHYYIYDKKTAHYNQLFIKRLSPKDRVIRERIILPQEKVLVYGILNNVIFDKASNTYNLSFVNPKKYNITKDPVSYFKGLFSNKLFIVSSKKDFNQVKNEIFDSTAKTPLIIAIILFLISFIFFYKTTLKLNNFKL